MITTEIMLVIVLILLLSAMYVMYRYFEDLLDGMWQETCKESQKNLDCLKETTNNIRNSFKLLEQEVKDGLQSNAICCRSAIDSSRSLIDKINSRISIIEKNQTGSIKVIKKDSLKKETK